MIAGYLPHGFDLFSVADLSLVDQARSHCDHLVVGVLTDEDIEARTGRRPVVPLSERLDIVSHVRGVDRVVVHDPDQLPAGVTTRFALPGATLLKGSPNPTRSC